MILTALTAFTAAALATTPFLWPHSTGLAVVTLLACAAATFGAVATIVDPRWRRLTAVAGVPAPQAFVVAGDDQRRAA